MIHDETNTSCVCMRTVEPNVFIHIYIYIYTWLVYNCYELSKKKTHEWLHNPGTLSLKTHTHTHKYKIGDSQIKNTRAIQRWGWGGHKKTGPPRSVAISSCPF